MDVDSESTTFPAQPASRDDRYQLTAEASLQAALGAFEQYMEDEGFAENTRKAFSSIG